MPTFYPPGTRKGNRTYVVRGRVGGREVEIVTGCGRRHGKVGAEGFWRGFKDRFKVQAAAAGDDRARAIALKLLQGARYRAKKKGMVCDLTEHTILAIIGRAGGRCELTNIPFSRELIPGSRRAPFAPSLDRIESGKGYTYSNCRLVAFSVNVALSDWVFEVLYRIVRAISAKPRPYR